MAYPNFKNKQKIDASHVWVKFIYFVLWSKVTVCIKKDSYTLGGGVKVTVCIKKGLYTFYFIFGQK